CFFFFQAEDGIRDFHVTGVQTCALPIFFAFDSNYEITNDLPSAAKFEVNDDLTEIKVTIQDGVYWHNGEPLEAEDYAYSFYIIRSEERRVGKECSSRWTRYDHSKDTRTE